MVSTDSMHSEAAKLQLLFCCSARGNHDSHGPGIVEIVQKV